MLQIKNILYAKDLEEAYRAYISEPDSVVLGGCGYLRLGSRKIATAIDLSHLNLDFIEKREDTIEIGAMTTLRAIETSPLTSDLWGGMLANSVSHIVGVQLRNIVTTGGTVAGRYAFSDPITALLALDAKVALFNHGEIDLADFLETKGLRDIVVKITIPDDVRNGAFASIRKSNTDYAILNCAVTVTTDSFRIVVGSRPGKAQRATRAEAYLLANGLNADTASKAGKIAAEELKFGDNPRGKGKYRSAICPVLIERCLAEVHK
ncbi:xanthine dehydrogenase family protein subunit M [Desulfopila sp. IMCC35008]|uniref:FAD binding domain-containing protein n=1 Tax=Desulfopila sp. IMCC35008 TaxID=2653858 RepID=UPI0013D2AA89|nr:FAD binding domain-containing protein [Desulfopila sp. IMCC35008]